MSDDRISKQIFFRYYENHGNSKLDETTLEQLEIKKEVIQEAY